MLYSRKVKGNSQKTKENLSKTIGNQYEALAKRYLEHQGLRFIEQNFSTKCGEIDLIMKDRQTIVFVEVKYRKQTHFGHAAEFVTRKKIQKLTRTAYLWLSKNGLSPHTTDFRFDVVAIHQRGDHIDWIKNAVTQG